MGVTTTFLIGTAVGAGVKWAYDKWQADDNEAESSATVVHEADQPVAHDEE